MNYTEVLQYLHQRLPMYHRTGPAALRPGLGNIEKLADITEQPHRHFKSVHVAGTNGKGSTSHLMAAALQTEGYRTGLFTSPHLKDFRERIRINGHMIDEESVVQFVNTFREQWQSFDASFFEITTAMAFWYFARQQVDIAVIEAGLGGRLDSTNILIPEVSVITGIGLDHTALLGDTIEKIAGEKAGIIKPGVPVIIGHMPEQARRVMKQKADECASSLTDASKRSEPPPCELAGNYQLHNRQTAWCALNVLRSLGCNLEEKSINSGFMNVVKLTGLLGRWQILQHKPMIIADVAHNADGVYAVMKQLSSMNFRQLHIVFGMVNDKDHRQVLSLLPAQAHYYFCRADIPRGLDAEKLKKQAEPFGLNGNCYNSVNEAYETARKHAAEEDVVLVCGSVFVVAEVL